MLTSRKVTCRLYELRLRVYSAATAKGVTFESSDYIYGVIKQSMQKTRSPAESNTAVPAAAIPETCLLAAVKHR